MWRIVVALVAVVIGAAAWFLTRGPVACADFHPTRASWEADRKKTAEAIVRCDTLIGWKQAEVWRLLGPEPHNSWIIETTDEGGTTDLGVSFGPGPIRDARVRSVRFGHAIS